MPGAGARFRSTNVASISSEFGVTGTTCTAPAGLPGWKSSSSGTLWHFVGSSGDDDVRKRRVVAGSVTTAALRAFSQPGTAIVPGSALTRKPWLRNASEGTTPSCGEVRSTSRTPPPPAGAFEVGGGADGWPAAADDAPAGGPA